MNYSSALSYKASNTTNSTHLYYDILITNNSSADNYPILRFNEIRNSPYLDAPEEYYMSVVRFKLDTSTTLPTYIVPIMPNQADINKTELSFTLTYGAYEARVYVGWSPENLSGITPSSPTVASQNNYPYYWGYSIQHFVDLLNSALLSGVTTLNSAYFAGTGMNIPNHTDYPVFLLDQNNKRLSIIARASLYNDALFPHIGIFCNSALWAWIGSFQAQYIGDGSTTLSSNGKNYKLRIYSIENTNFYLQNNNASPPVFIYTALQMYQEFSLISNWSACQKIVFTTGILPVNPALVANPVVYNTNNKLLNTGNNSNILNVLTDFEEQTLTGDIGYKPAINYTPTAEYRLIDLLGNNPLSALEISVFWSDKFGNLYPLTLGAGATCNIKLMFRKKDFQALKVE